MPDLFHTLDEILSHQPYIDGESFTVSDVAVGSYLLYIPAFFPQVGRGVGQSRHGEDPPSPHFGDNAEDAKAAVPALFIQFLNARVVFTRLPNQPLSAVLGRDGLYVG